MRAKLTHEHLIPAVWPGGFLMRAYSAGVLCAAAMMSFAGKVLSEKIDVLQLAFYTAPVSSCVLLPFFWILEVSMP